MSDTSSPEISHDNEESTAESEVELVVLNEKQSSRVQTVNFCVTELTCPNSCLRITRSLKVFPGVISIKISQIIQQCQVVFSSSVTNESEIIEKIRSKGFTVIKLFPFDVEGQLIISYKEGNRGGIMKYLKNRGVNVIDESVEQKQIQVFSHGPRQLIQNNIIPVTYQFNNYSFLRDILTHKKSILYHKALIGIGLVPLIPLVLIYVFSLITTWTGDPFQLNYPIFRSLTVKNMILFGMTFPVLLFYAALFFKNWKHFLSISIFDENILVFICVWLSYISSLLAIIVDLLRTGMFDRKTDFFLEQSALIVLFHLYGKFFEIQTNKSVAKWMVKLIERHIDIPEANVIQGVSSDRELLDKLGVKRGKRRKKRRRKKKKKMEDITQVDKDLVFRYDYLKVNHDEIIPYDGVIIFIDNKNGIGSINQTFFDGQRALVEKKEGDFVLGGTKNLGDAFYMRVTKKHASVFSKIIRYGMESQLDDFSHFSTRMFSYIIPVVVVFAISSFIMMLNFAYIFFGFSDTLYKLRTNGYLYALVNALNIVLIASPCSWAQFAVLVRAVAVEVLVKAGMLVTKTNFLRTLRDINYIVVNKNGVLSTGTYEVFKSKVFAKKWKERKNEFHKIVASVEKFVNNSVGRCLYKFCREKFDGSLFNEVRGLYHVRGKGIKAEIGGNKVLIGSKLFMKENDIKIRKRRIQKDTNTHVFVAIDGKSIGGFTLSEKPRDEMHEVVNEIQRSNITVVMVTGDEERVAKKFANEFGVDDYFAGLSPKAKGELISEFKEKGQKVMFVGSDVLMDHPAIKSADFSVSSGANFNSIFQPDLLLLKENFRSLLLPFDLERKLSILKIVNIALVSCYHLIGIPLVSGWILSFMGVFVPNFICSVIKICFNFLLSLIAVIFGKILTKSLSQYD